MNDLSVVIYLALLVVSIVAFAWCFDTFMCKLPSSDQAFLDACESLRRANSEFTTRDRLKEFRQ